MAFAGAVVESCQLSYIIFGHGGHLPHFKESTTSRVCGVQVIAFVFHFDGFPAVPGEMVLAIIHDRHDVKRQTCASIRIHFVFTLSTMLKILPHNPPRCDWYHKTMTTGTSNVFAITRFKVGIKDLAKLMLDPLF